MSRALFFYLLALLVCSIALLVSLNARAEMCDGGVVNPGAHRFEVERRCGEPAFKDAWPHAFLFGYGVISQTEVWFYNRGSNRLTRRFYFRDGRLVKIETGGFGYDTLPSRPCDPAIIHPGMSEFDLLIKCGEPVERDRHVELPVSPLFGWRRIPPVRPLQVEIWAYDFGDNRFMRFVTVVNGRVAEVKTGDRGSP